MGEFIVYSVKVSLCLVMFYVFYKLLLSRTTLHTFNRFVILALVVMSLVLPFVHLTVKEPVMEGTVMIDQMLMMATVVEEAQPTFHLSLINVLVLIYIRCSRILHQYAVFLFWNTSYYEKGKQGSGW